MPPPQINGITTFCTPVDNAASTLAAPRRVGDTGMAVASGSGPLFGLPTPSAPVRITVIAASALDSASRVTDRAKISTFRCTGRSGDVLTGLSLESGVDQAYAAGDYVGVLKTAATDADQNAAVNALEAAVLALAGSVALKAPLAGPAFTGTPTVSGSPVATQGWVSSQGYSASGGSGGGPFSGVFASAAPYLVGVQGTSNAAALSALFASLPSGDHTVVLDAVTFSLEYPVWVPPGISIVGAGPGRTRIDVNGFDAFIVGPGAASRSGGTFSYGDSSRPDLFGVMDSSLASGTGQAWGFDTKGRSFALDLGCGLTFGSFDQATNSHSYWGTDAGFTAFLAFDGGVLPGATICGAGGYQSAASPFWFAVPNVANTLGFYYRRQGDAAGVNRVVYIPGFNLTAGVVNRVQYWQNHVTGAFGARVNGSSVTPTPANNSGDLPVAGGYFESADRDQPFQIGDQSTSVLGSSSFPFKLYGARFCNTAVTADPGTDAARYADATGSTVGYFNVRSKVPGRLLTLQSGAASTGQPCFAPVFDGTDYGDFTAGFKLQGVTVTGGGVCLAGSLNAYLAFVACVGGRSGFSAAHTQCNYQTDAYRCEFAGDVAAVRLFETIGSFQSCTLSRGGISSIIDTSCSLTWNRTQMTGFGQAQRRAVDMLNGSYAGATTFYDTMIDAESSNVFSSEIFRVDNVTSVARTFTVRNGACGGLNTSGVIFRLKDTGGSGNLIALIDVQMFGLCPAAAIADVQGSVVGHWVGVIDCRQAPTFPGPTGSAYDPAKLKILT